MGVLNKILILMLQIIVIVYLVLASGSGLLLQNLLDYIQRLTVYGR